MYGRVAVRLGPPGGVGCRRHRALRRFSLVTTLCVSATCTWPASAQEPTETAPAEPAEPEETEAETETRERDDDDDPGEAPIELPPLDAVEVVADTTPEVAPEPAPEPAPPRAPELPPRSYAARSQRTATRDELPVRDVPQSISVVPSTFVHDLAATRTDEALVHVPGVQLRAGFGGRWDDYTIRGFPVWVANTYRNGYLNGYSSPAATDAVNVERIEVLRGPAAVLYGPGLPGGSINFVSRVPEATRHLRVGASVGSFDTYRGELDATGPLGDDAVAYRLMAAGESTQGYRDFNRWHRWLANPMLAWTLRPGTTLLVDVSAFQQRYRADAGGVPAIDGDPLALPVRRSFSEPTLPLSDMRGGHVRLELTKRLNARLSLRVGVQSKLVRYTEHALMPLGLLDDGRTLARIATRWQLRGRDGAVQAALHARFRTGPIEHRLVAGIDASYEHVLWRFGTSDPVDDPNGIDVLDPSYGSLPAPVSFPAGGDNTWTYAIAGLYVNDVVTFLPGLRAMIGARVDGYQQRSRTGDVDDVRGEVAPTFRAGVVWDPIEALAIYASGQRGYWPVLGVAATGTLLAPERSWAFEAGARAELAEDVLTLDAAFFLITNKNISVPDPDNPDFQVQRGRARSQGAEVELTARAGRIFRAHASYAFTDAEVTADPDPALVGRPLPLSAHHSGAVWAQVEAPRRRLRGLGLGLGVVATGQRSLGDGTVVDGYARLDAVASYQRERFGVRLRGENLANTRYVRAGQDASAILPGAPRGFLLSVEARH